MTSPYRESASPTAPGATWLERLLNWSPPSEVQRFVEGAHGVAHAAVFATIAACSAWRIAHRTAVPAEGWTCASIAMIAVGVAVTATVLRRRRGTTWGGAFAVAGAMAGALAMYALSK